MLSNQNAHLLEFAKKEGRIQLPQQIENSTEDIIETLYELGYNHYKEDPESTEAFSLFYQAALQNHTKAQFQVGYMYTKGYGIAQDYNLGMDWLKKSARTGNVKAILTIGEYHEYGYHTPTNIHVAIEWYTKAANRGNATAQFNLGRIYEFEEEVNDLQKAINWYQKAVKGNHDDAKMFATMLNEQGYYAENDGKGKNSYLFILS
jgi:TPR repeat protein